MLFTDLYCMLCSMAFSMSMTVSNEMADGRIFRQASRSSGKSNLVKIGNVTGTVFLHIQTHFTRLINQTADICCKMAQNA